jgi:hypothetical protein
MKPSSPAPTAEWDRRGPLIARGRERATPSAAADSARPPPGAPAPAGTSQERARPGPGPGAAAWPAGGAPGMNAPSASRPEGVPRGDAAGELRAQRGGVQRGGGR